MWGTLSQIRDVCMDFEPCFKGYNLVSVYPTIIRIDQMTTLNAYRDLSCGDASLSIG